MVALLYKLLAEKARNGNTEVRENMIKVYKIMYGLKKINVCFQSKYQDPGDSVKLIGRQSKTNLKKHYFTEGEIKLWNCHMT